MTPTPSAPPTRPSPITSPVLIPGAGTGKIPVDVIDVGEGRPIVFLHGLVGLNDHWEDVARRIQSKARCIMLQVPLLSLRGDDCSIQGVTDLTVRFLEKFVGEKATLVGNSFGGHVALRIALDRPDLLRGLVLAGASGLIERTMVREVQIRPSRPWLEEKIAELFYDRSKMNAADVDRAHQALSERGHARAMVKLSRSARRNHLGERVASITAPTLLIWGRQDVVTPPEACEELLRKVKNSRVVWFDNCGHAPMLENPELFAEALGDFVTELDRRA